MNIQELGTIMQSKVDVKVIILNNNFRNGKTVARNVF